MRLCWRGTNTEQQINQLHKAFTDSLVQAVPTFIRDSPSTVKDEMSVAKSVKQIC